MTTTTTPTTAATMAGGQLTGRPNRWGPRIEIGAWGLGIALVLLLPFLGLPPIWTAAVAITLAYVPAALGQNLILGNAGMLSMGQAAFMGVGAYTAGILAVHVGLDGAATLLAAIIAAGVAGLIVGIPALRISGDYLFIVSLGFNLIVMDIALQWVDVTGGATGLTGIPLLTMFGIDLGLGTPFYLTSVVVVLLACLATWVVTSSRYGLTLESIRDDLPAAVSVGITPGPPRVVAFGIGSALAGVSGWMLAYNLGYVGSVSFNANASLLIFEMAVIGGLGRISGSVVGAIIVILLPELLRPLQDYRELLAGLVIVILMVVRPEGLLGRTKIVNLIKK